MHPPNPLHIKIHIAHACFGNIVYNSDNACWSTPSISKCVCTICEKSPSSIWNTQTWQIFCHIRAWLCIYEAALAKRYWCCISEPYKQNHHHHQFHHHTSLRLLTLYILTHNFSIDLGQGFHIYTAFPNEFYFYRRKPNKAPYAPIYSCICRRWAIYLNEGTKKTTNDVVHS